MRATPVNMRKALEVTRLYAESGVLFVPMPVLSDSDHAELIAQAGERLERMAQQNEHGE